MKLFKTKNLLSILLILALSCQKNSNNNNDCGVQDTTPPSAFSISGGTAVGAPFVDYNRQIKDIGTNFVVEEFFQTPSALFNFMKVVYGNINTALTQYRKANNLSDHAVFLLFKGGNVLRMVANAYIDQLPEPYKGQISDKYAEYFRRSDADFSVYVDENLVPDYNKTFEEITLLVFAELDKIRSIFMANPSTYFDFFALPSSKADSILNNTFDTLGSLTCIKNPENKTWYGADFTQMELPNASAEPQPVCSYTGEYDYRYTEGATDGVAVSVTRVSDQSHWIYNTDNRVLQWSWGSDPSKLVKFYLVRSKVGFQYIYAQQQSVISKDVGGELIDVSLPERQDARLSHFLEGYDTFVETYDISYKGQTIAVRAYSLKYLMEDLEFIIFDSFDRPWHGGGKYEKRVYRLFFLYMINMFSQLNTTQQQAYLNTVQSEFLEPLAKLSFDGSAADTAILKQLQDKEAILEKQYPNILMNQFLELLIELAERLNANSMSGDLAGFEQLLKVVNNNVDFMSKLSALGANLAIELSALRNISMDDLF